MNYYFIIITSIILFKLSKLNIIINKSNESTCDYFYSSCAINILKESAVDNTVIFLTLSNKFISQFYNFWIVSVLSNKLTNLVIITFDEKSYTFSKEKSKNVLKYNIKMNQTDDIVFLNEDYIQVTRSKIYICKYILDLNLSVFVIDPDIALFKNPFHFILSAKNYDIVAQYETPFERAINNGFVLYRSNEKMKSFFKILTEDKKFISGKIKFEQGHINNKLLSNRYNISLYLLPLENFMSGWKLLREGIFFPDDIKKCIIILLTTK